MDDKKHIKSYSISKKELLSLLNPHLQNFYSFNDKDYEVKNYDAKELFFNINRFDLVAKYIYAYYYINNFKTEWHKEIYKEHIRAFSNNTLKEGDGKKHTLDDYYVTFNRLISEIKKNGFNPKVSLLPIDDKLMIIDGAHRLSVSFLFSREVSTVKLKRTSVYNYSYFIKNGLSQDISDFIALNYCELNIKTKIVNIFPIAKLNENKIESILKKFGAIYYKKDIFLTETAQNFIVKEMYFTEHWIGNKTNNYKGAKERAKISFNSKNNLKVYVFIPFTNDSAIRAKAEIRQVIAKGNYPVHINDTHEETIRLAQIYFNNNSIHFINFKKNKQFYKFNTLFEKYKHWIEENKYNRNDFCVDASSTLSAYGLREGADLDFLYGKQDDILTGFNLIDCHNIHSHYYKTSIDNIIYNPMNYFYFEGYKFISIQQLRNMKKVKMYRKIRIKAHRIIPIDSILWNITKKWFYFLKKIRKNGKEYYSQTNQDKYLDTEIFKLKENGFFLDIGAHDGITFSNTYFFEKNRKWKGICIEPLPNIFKELKKNRSCLVVNACISNENKTEEFLKIEGYSEMLSGLSKNYNKEHLGRIDKELKEYGGKKEIINVECYNINYLLEKYHVKTIDYCSIDVEGSEFTILKTIDFNKFDIRVLTVENNYKDIEPKLFMESKGYKLHTTLGADDVYIKNIT